MSLELTATVLSQYKARAKQLSSYLISLHKIITLASPSHIDTLSHTLTSAARSLSYHARKHLLKLSKLLTSTLAAGIPVPHPCTSTSSPAPPPLIGPHPSLSDTLSLGRPPHTPVIPTLRQPKPLTPSENTESNPPKLTVHNLSSHTLTETETSVLSKGLTFAPTYRFDHFRLVADTQAFVRSFQWDFFHRTSETSESDQQTDAMPRVEPSLHKFLPPSKKDLPPLPPTHPMVQFSEFLLTNVAHPSFPTSLQQNPNLTPSEFRALRSLKHDNDIMILPADKGSSVVVLDREDVIEESLRLLSDTDAYTPVQHDHTQSVATELRKLLKAIGPFQNFSNDTINLLVPDEPHTPSFYILPKVHKEGHPGRPIVSGIGSPTERISALVDHHLQPLVAGLPSYIKDTNHFLHCLSSITHPLPPGALLATIDVTSLYTNIPHTPGLKAVESFLNTRPQPASPTTAFLCELVHKILTSNYFRFGDKFYHQRKGTAMGTRMAPSYANLFMGKLEKDFLASETLQPLCWFRYIDDIFTIWCHGPDTLNAFLSHLNSFSSLHFTWSISSSTITFLDVDIQLDNGSLHTSVHIKPTNLQQYLHFNSCHPPHTKRALPYSLATRAKRICSSYEGLARYCDGLLATFTSRGYPTSLVQRQIHRAIHNNTKTSSKPSNSIGLVTTYFPGLQKINRLLREGHIQLLSSSVTKEFYPTPPKVIFRRPRNLQDILVRRHVTYSPTPRLPPGNFPCDNSRCLTCPILTPGTSFCSPSTGLSYPIQGHHSCRTTNSIYMLQCKFCPAFYIGLCSTKLNLRINNHRSSCNQLNPTLPVPVHVDYHNTNFQDSFTVTILCSLPPTSDPKTLRYLEVAHQLVLQSRLSPGLNTQ